MSFVFEQIRYWLFRFTDLIKGGSIQKMTSEITSLNDNYAKALTHQQYQLKKILDFATTTTDYYREYAGKPLQDFPVINKNIIREKPDKFISSHFNKDALVKVVTSGSTGTPFSVYHDAFKKKRNTADTIVFARQAGFEIGHKLYYFKIWNKINKKTSLGAWMQNIVPVNVFDLSDAAIEQLIERLNKDKATIGFLSYASALDAFCRYMKTNSVRPVKANVRSIIAMSEALNDFTKEHMQTYFGVPCVSRYSNVENGIIAQQSTSGGKEFYINFASYCVEILNVQNNDSCKPGEPGRIVVTDLYNYAQPMLRYDTGDIGILSFKNINGQQTPVLEKIEGRKMDMVFNTNGELVSSFTITNTMWKYTELKQYQFIQKGQKEYLFKLNCDVVFNREQELISEFKNYFGLDAVFYLEYIDEIPLLDSGKRKKVLNAMKDVKKN